MYFMCCCILYKDEVKNTELIESYITPHQNGKVNNHRNLENYNDTPKLNGALPLDHTIIKLEDEFAEKRISIEETIEQPKSKTATPNQCLDEIIPASEIADSFREINSNGKIILIEDTSSKITQEGKVEEDASSVIAILDNVLQIEDVEFNRKASVDSEMLPSFVETSTIAMIHSSCDSFKEEENEDSTEISDGKQSNKDESTTSNLEKRDVNGTLKILTEEQTDNLMTSKDLNLKSLHETNDNIERDNNKDLVLKYTEETTLNVSETISLPNPQEKTPSRKSSISSHSESEKDAVHSNSFKQKLNQILLGRSPLVNVKGKKDNGKSILPKVEPVEEQSMRPSLKQSKSETDIRYFLENEPDEEENKFKKDETSSNEQKSNIPKAPKFDPILYKTVGMRKRSQTRERPKLDDFIANSPIKRNNFKVESPPQIEPLATTPPGEEIKSTIPFKEKLEAILKRGPSYRITKARSKSVDPGKAIPGKVPTVEKTENSISMQSTEAIKPTSVHEANDESTGKQQSKQYKNNFSEVLKSIQQIKEIQVNSDENHVENTKRLSSRPTTIQEALEGLKPVHVR